MKVLVTGATGFTGGRLARWLVQRGDSVRGLVRDRRRTESLERDGIDVTEGDLKDVASLRRAAAGVEIIYNVAALYRTARLPAAEYKAVNAIAVGSLVQVASEQSIRRVVHCSTVGVHGDVGEAPANEDAPLRPGDVYQETKLEGEHIGLSAAKQMGVELVIARPSGIYGPGDKRLFKLFGAIARRRFVLLGSGRIYYHLTYVDDVCEGLHLCATTPKASGRVYILAGAEVTTLRDLVRLTAEIAGVPPPKLRLPVWPVWIAGALCEALCAPLGIEPPLYRRRVDFFTKSRAFETSRARQELGFKPAVGLRAGIGRTLEWYREQGWI